jgi:hypothetical protein
VVVWAKIEGFGEGRAGGPDKPETEGFGQNRPGPPIEPCCCAAGEVRSAAKIWLSICEKQIDGQGFRVACARFVNQFGR